LLAAKWFFTLDDRNEEVRQRLLAEGLKQLDQQLVRQAQGDAALAGMASTLTAALSIGAELFLVQVGDSRAYLFRDGQLKQLTHDQTLAQTMVEAGLLRPEAVRTARVRHVLTSALGGGCGVEAETHKLHLTDGDRLLLCTNGLTGLVDDEQIANLLRRNPRPGEACHALVNDALDRGGSDNITVILAAYAIQEQPWWAEPNPAQTSLVKNLGRWKSASHQDARWATRDSGCPAAQRSAGVPNRLGRSCRRG
jgi:protein phosphatase